MIEGFLTLYPRAKDRLAQCKECKWFMEYNPPYTAHGTPVFGCCTNPEGWLINEETHMCTRFKQKWEGRVDIVLPNLEAEIGGVGVPIHAAQKNDVKQP